MNVMYALCLGVLFSAGIYMMLRRSLIKMVVGFGLVGHAINMLVFSSGGIGSFHAPIIEKGKEVLQLGVVADPLPQALVLTAIVIGFGAQIFLLVLLRTVWAGTENQDIETWKEEEA